MRCSPTNPAQRRYLFRFMPTMILYATALIAATYAFRHDHPTGALAYTLAVLPAIPLLGVLIIVGVYLNEESDEFERTVVIQSMLLGFGATLAITTIWGFLEIFTNIRHLAPFSAFPMFWMFVGIFTPIVRWRYR
jgi:hypothetical protein